MTLKARLEALKKRMWQPDKGYSMFVQDIEGLDLFQEWDDGKVIRTLTRAEIDALPNTSPVIVVGYGSERIEPDD